MIAAIGMVRQRGGCVDRRLISLRASLGSYRSCDLRQINGIGVVFSAADTQHSLWQFCLLNQQLMAMLAVGVTVRVIVRMRVAAAEPIAVYMRCRVVFFLFRRRHYTVRMGNRGQMTDEKSRDYK